MIAGKHGVSLIILISLLYVGFYFSSPAVLAEAIGTPGYDLLQTPLPAPAPVYTTVITGYVVDEDGNGVPAAVVTLWQNGKVWVFDGKIDYNGGSRNPQATSIMIPGTFTFGEVSTGNYTVRAEKDGFIGTTYFYVSSDTGQKFIRLPMRYSETSVKITLKGYRLPVFSEAQLAYGGAVNGTVSDRSYHRPGANVSLWQNGEMVKMPKNPQIAASPNGSYLFEHLPPGDYSVRAEVYDFFGIKNNSTSVIVANNTVTADLVITSLHSSGQAIATLPPAPDSTPTYNSTPVQPTTLNTSTGTPAPSPGTEFIVIALIVAAMFAYCIRR